MPTASTRPRWGGDIVVVGDFQGTALAGGGALVAVSPSPDIFLVRYRSSDGAHVWSVRRGGTSTETAYAMGTDGTNVYVGAGSRAPRTSAVIRSSRMGSYYEAFAAKYSAINGAHIWSRQFGGAGHHDETQTMAVSSSKVAIGVSFSGTVQIGAQMLRCRGTTSD